MAVMSMTDEDWKLDGLCREVDPDLWFPGKSESAAPAKKICGMCGVREECLAWALAHDEEGVWGGLSRKEREKLRRPR